MTSDEGSSIEVQNIWYNLKLIHLVCDFCKRTLSDATQLGIGIFNFTENKRRSITIYFDYYTIYIASCMTTCNLLVSKR